MWVTVKFQFREIKLVEDRVRLSVRELSIDWENNVSIYYKTQTILLDNIVAIIF